MPPAPNKLSRCRAAGPPPGGVRPEEAIRGHPTTDQIRRFLDVSGPTRGQQTALHLLECERCRRAAVRELEHAGGETELLARVLRHPAVGRLPAAAEAHAADAPPAEDRLLARLSTAIEEVNACGGLLAELRRHPLERWPLLFENSNRYRSLALARELIHAGHREGFEDPARGAAIVRLGIELAERLDPALYGDRLLDDVRARGWAIVGDCYRLAGDLKAADAAFRRSARLIEDSPDPEELATHLFLRGVLRKDQRRFAEASRLFERARRLSEEIGDRDKVARILKDMTIDVKKCCEDGTLKEIEGIGDSSRRIIEQYVKEGRSTEYEDLASSVPDGLIPMLDIPSLGPKTIALLWKERGITSLDELVKAIDEGRLEGLKGIGEAGTIASTVTVYNAVMDALAPLGVMSVRMPLTPERVWKAIAARE